jgi:hypothetical protein
MRKTYKITMTTKSIVQYKENSYLFRRFNDWIVLEYLERDLYGSRLFSVACKCGNLYVRTLDYIKTRARQCRQCSHVTHGATKDSLYCTWNNIKNRCLNPNIKEYKNYGGRGISMCAEWLDDFHSFKRFAIDNGWTQGLQTDRINNDGNYEPCNIRFVTPQVNNMNKRTNTLCHVDGVAMTWANASIQMGKAKNYISTIVGRDALHLLADNIKLEYKCLLPERTP